MNDMKSMYVSCALSIVHKDAEDASQTKDYKIKYHKINQGTLLAVLESDLGSRGIARLSTDGSTAVVFSTTTPRR